MATATALMSFVLLAMLCRLCFLVGVRRGYRRGYNHGGTHWAKRYALQVGRLNVALGSLSVYEIAEALKDAPADKITALHLALDRKAARAGADARALLEEWTRT